MKSSVDGLGMRLMKRVLVDGLGMRLMKSSVDGLGMRLMKNSVDGLGMRLDVAACVTKQFHLHTPTLTPSQLSVLVQF